MPMLPNPFDPAASDAAAGQAVASSSPALGDAAADLSETCDIGEIFVGARKLFDPDPAGYTNADQVYYDLLKAQDDPHTADLIDMPYGMEGLFDPAPLFLRQAG